MTIRTFNPWIGQNYDSEGLHGCRILFLGESHYGSPEEEGTSFTQDVIRNHALTPGKRFFTMVAKIGLIKYSGDNINNTDRSRFWNSVAFYNYVQEFVSNGPRVRPTESMWDRGKEPFLKLLEEIKPDLVVVLGKDLGNRIPAIPSNIKTVRMNHPSSGFSYKAWLPSLEQAIEDLAK